MSTRTPTVLERILAETREEVERRKLHTPPRELVGGERASVAGSRPFRDALMRERIGVIAEAASIAGASTSPVICRRIRITTKGRGRWAATQKARGRGRSLSPTP